MCRLRPHLAEQVEEPDPRLGARELREAGCWPITLCRRHHPSAEDRALWAQDVAAKELAWELRSMLARSLLLQLVAEAETMPEL